MNNFSVHAYINFDGNCREAMTFYQKCFGGQLDFQTVGSAHLSSKMNRRMKSCILHATLRNGNLLLMGSDMAAGNGIEKGNSITLALNCKSEKNIAICYKKLSRNGRQTHPPEKTIWGCLLGALTDKYGITWLLICPKNREN